MPCVNCREMNNNICMQRCVPPVEAMTQHLSTVLPASKMVELRKESELLIAAVYKQATNPS
ncbi:hypothetical protein K08M3_50030 [Vibrio alginolyticus]|uniref:Uncharacterized protein n=1 Tax=Vibrio alginolyticus TaxID=663 RepID=A0A1W6UFA2_VIBAL|nr:hypothetical protein K04M1_49900 [Vibrio alginolyticus]WKV20318.1 hypothetical protein [Vibrio parahaemolyticus]ARP11618.1 hypothetical protein K04M3_50490 [Vibrio alginolyticus]ARP16699.1 hypothetical protein K04M5_50470 [Vibrio alginolyticus]ARP21718.1 hypothetical protein K05K4_50090 [Vibrio alginolyticus]